MTIDIAPSPPTDPIQGQAVRRFLVVFNPAAGRKRRPRLTTMVTALRAQGCTVAMVETNAPGHAEEIARTISPEQYDVIIAAGGDGTVNEIVNGLGDAAVALGIFPLGTANVLADELKLPRAPDKLARLLAEGPLRSIRTGVANGRRFCMMAGTGFDARVVAGVSLPLKKKIGPLAYVVEMARLAMTEKSHGCEVRVDGQTYRTMSAVACKGRYYGGPFIAVPAASVRDDLLHVVLMDGSGLSAAIRYGVSLALGRIGKLPDVRIVAGRSIEFTGETGAPVQADGDIITQLPVEIAIHPSAVNVIAP